MMNIDEKIIDAMILDYQEQHRQLSNKPKRTQAFNHDIQLSKLEGQLLSLILVKSLCASDVNVIEQ